MRYGRKFRAEVRGEIAAIREHLDRLRRDEKKLKDRVAEAEDRLLLLREYAHAQLWMDEPSGYGAIGYILGITGAYAFPSIPVRVARDIDPHAEWVYVPDRAE